MNFASILCVCQKRSSAHIRVTFAGYLRKEVQRLRFESEKRTCCWGQKSSLGWQLPFPVIMSRHDNNDTCAKEINPYFFLKACKLFWISRFTLDRSVNRLQNFEHYLSSRQNFYCRVNFCHSLIEEVRRSGTQPPSGLKILFIIFV